MDKTWAILIAIIMLTGTVINSGAQEKAKNFDSRGQKQWQAALNAYDYRAIAATYANYMIEYGRDRYGEIHSPLFVTIMDRKTSTVFKYRKVPYAHVVTKPYAPGLRRDYKLRPNDRTYSGGNLLQDIPLYGLLYRLTELTNDSHYAEEADKSIDWFLEHAQSPVTGLYSWGSHMYWDVYMDKPIYASSGRIDGGYGGHEYNYVWPHWDRHPEALTRFAHGLWDNQIYDKQTGRFSRHAEYYKHGPGEETFEFPQTGSCYIDIWAREYGRSGDPEMKQAIQTLLRLYRSMRDPVTGAMSWCTAEGADRREVSNVQMNLFMATTVQDAAGFVKNRDLELAEDMIRFARFFDDEYLSNDYNKILDVANKGIPTYYTITDRTDMSKGLILPPAGVNASVGFPLKTPDGRPATSLYNLTPWFPERSYAKFALLLPDRYERCEEKHKSTYRRALLDIADIYMSISPEVQFVQCPDNISDVVCLLRYVYKLTGEVEYLHRADLMMKWGIRLFFDETSPLPKITNFDDWYESSLKNASSVEIFIQMLELSLDIEALPKKKRVTPQVMTEEKDGGWYAELNTKYQDMLLLYGKNKNHGLYLSQARTTDGLKVNLSDIITRIPSVEEADSLNGKMDKFSGKEFTSSRIEYGGFKDVPTEVKLVIRNTGKTVANVHVCASLNDTYHDNGQIQDKKMLNPNEEGIFEFSSPSLKWIRTLLVKGSTSSDSLQLESIAFVTTPRSQLTQNNP